jgi:hypothetical protein
MARRRPSSAQDEFERFMSRNYVIYRFANSASAVLRTLGQPELVRRPRLNWANHAIDIGTGVWLWQRLSRRGTAEDIVAEAVEAATGTAHGAIGLSALHTKAAQHGTAWPMIVGLWRASGTAAFSERWPVRAAGLGAMLSPYMVPSRRQRRMAESGLVWGHTATLGAFAAIGALIADGMRRRARDIDRRSDDLARAQVAAAAHRAETELRQEVLSQTLEVMRRIRAELRTDPDGCAELARSEETRLRAWLRGDAMAPAKTPTAVPTDEAIGAELRVRRLLRLAETTIRATALGVFLGNLVANRRTMRWPWLGWAVGAMATANFVLVVRVMRNSPDDLPYLAVAAGDTVMMIAATEWEGIQPDPPVGWISGYAMACASTIATMGTPRDGWAGPVALMCAWRAMAVMRDHDIALGRRAAQVACETIYIAGNAWLSHDFADASVDQARDLVTATTQLAFERRLTDLEVVRLHHQAIVHDGAIQVLLWVGKDDLTTEQIEAWLDQEIPRVERAARGEPDTPVAPLGPALEELAAGFGRLGVEVTLTDVDTSPTNTLVKGALVEVVNEALTNVLRHASTRTAVVSLRVEDDELVLRIVDGGRAGRSVDVGAGTGTATIRDLAAMIGGTVEWTVTRTGGVAVELHCPAVA